MIDVNYIFILWIFLISLGINLCFFIIAFTFKSDAFTDITYALTFILITTIVLIWKQQFSITQIISYLLVIIWATRLGSYLLIRILKIKVDHRFDKMRNSFIKFLGFWILQAITIFLIVLPTSFILFINKNYFKDFDYYSLIFFIIALFGIIFEGIADLQKYNYYNNRKTDSKFINSGLWKISRHPNYFGEIIFWWFLSFGFLLNLLANNNSNRKILFQILWLLSPLYIMLMLIFLSGLPLLEVQNYKKLKDNKEYEKYIKKTSAIIPFIGKKGYILKVKKLKRKKK